MAETVSPTTRSAPSKVADPKPAPQSPEALGAETVKVVQALVDARSRVWTSGREGDLATVFVSRSAAWERDRSDLRSAASQSARYQGLRFTVRRADLKDTRGTTVNVEAVVDRSAYQLISTRGSQQVPASLGERTVLSLEWTEAGWRITDWK